MISRVHMSMTDSRVVKFNFIRDGELVDIKIVFENVHKKHQFAELLQLGPGYLSEKQGELIEEEKKEEENDDLKVLCMTWNMARQ